MAWSKAENTDFFIGSRLPRARTALCSTNLNENFLAFRSCPFPLSHLCFASEAFRSGSEPEARAEHEDPINFLRV